MRSVVQILAFICLAGQIALGQTNKTKIIEYLNQEPPGLTSKLFAPGLVSLNNEFEFGSIFSKDGREFYYAVDVQGKAEIRFMKLDKEEWTAPEKLLISDKYSYNDQFFSPDESRLFFISDMPLDGQGNKKDYDIWYIERSGNNWSTPLNAGHAINSEKNEYYFSFSQIGTMYFSSNAGTNETNHNNFDIYTSKVNNGEFEKAVKLDENINSQSYEADVFVAYDESYMIFCGDRPEGYGKGDLYISFKKSEGTWTTSKNMGKTINTEGHELCPFVTKDGK